MTTIWRFNLAITDEQTISMPAHARILAVGVREGNLCLWARVDPEMTLEQRCFRILGTGNPIEPPLRGETYLGTADMGMFVWHVWEVAL